MRGNHPIRHGLEVRRRELKMSRAALAQRSGVSAPTVYRILAGGLDNAHFRYVLAIARALGMTIHFDPTDESEPLRFQAKPDAYTLIEKEATRKAERLVGMVQATSGLEGQAVDPETARGMVRQTAAELIAGSRRRLWSN
jgi:transcriptional regulator with XRE-family HTH domain